MMPKFFSNNSYYSIGDIVHLLNVALPKFEEIAIPDFYIIVRDIDNIRYELVPAWKIKIPRSLLIWARPSNIYTKTELCFQEERIHFQKNELYTIKNADDAIQRIYTQQKRMKKVQKHKYHNKQQKLNHQITKKSKELDIQTNMDFSCISNFKACQGGRVSPK